MCLKYSRLLFWLLFVLALRPTVAFAQSPNLQAGPVVGGVTANSATVVFKTTPNATVDVQYKPTCKVPTFPEKASAKAGPDGWAKLKLENLSAACMYNATIGEGNGAVNFSFKTFPAENAPPKYFRFAFGSCSDKHNQPEMPTVDQVLRFKPEFFLHVGDWGYPDTTDRPFEPAKAQNYYAIDPKKVEEAYLERYTNKVMAPLLRSMPIDYVYDDHDFANDNSGGYACNYYRDKKRGPYDLPTPPSVRKNLIGQYAECFPHYDLPDTNQGIYHSFRYGDCEFFVLDLRANRTPTMQSIVKQDDKWVFAPKPEYTIMGKPQLQWFKDALSKSTAHWKFIISSVTFNVAIGDMLNSFLALPKQEFKKFLGLFYYPAGSMAAVMADGWSGYPYEQTEVLNHCREQGIKNVIVLSGDTHISCTDDGANGGFPEMMSGGLTQGSKDSYYLSKWLNLNQWNSGVQGVSSKGFVNSFGGVEVFGKDSVRLVAVTEKGDTISSLMLYDGFHATPEVVLERSKKTFADFTFFHAERLNPQKPLINPYFPKPNKKLLKQAVMTVYNDQGKKLYEQDNLKLKGKSLKYPIEMNPDGLAPGYYFVTISTDKAQFAKRVYLPAK